MNIMKIVFRKSISRYYTFFTQKNISILLYHNVGDYPVPGAVSTKNFENTKFSCRKYLVISIDEAADITENKKKLTKDFSVVTFDDGTKEFINHILY